MLTLLLSPQLFPSLFFVAGGLSLVALNLLSSGRRGGTMVWLGAGVALASCGVGIAGFLLQWTPAMWLPPLCLACIYAAFFVLPSPEVAAGLFHFAAMLRRRQMRTAGLLLAIGLAMGISLTRGGDEPGFEKSWNPGQSGIVREAPRHLLEVPGTNVFTDRGHRIAMTTNADPQAAHLDAPFLQQQFALLSQKGLRDEVIHLPVGWTNSNCHGWTFTGGQYWVSSEQVETILRDNSYRLMPAARAGDLAVYRNAEGAVTHTGIVRYVNAGTGLILVESKWGAMGRFIHPHDAHPYLPDTARFYRSQRSGHRLVGLTPGSGPSTVPESFELSNLLAS